PRRAGPAPPCSLGQHAEGGPVATREHVERGQEKVGYDAREERPRICREEPVDSQGERGAEDASREAPAQKPQWPRQVVFGAATDDANGEQENADRDEENDEKKSELAQADAHCFF